LHMPAKKTEETWNLCQDNWPTEPRIEPGTSQIRNKRVVPNWHLVVRAYSAIFRFCSYKQDGCFRLPPPPSRDPSTVHCKEYRHKKRELFRMARTTFCQNVQSPTWAAVVTERPWMLTMLTR
jgi:hypothetical protein